MFSLTSWINNCKQYKSLKHSFIDLETHSIFNIICDAFSLYNMLLY